MTFETQDPRTESGSSGTSAGDLARYAPPVILAIVLAVFAFANTESTTIDFVITEKRAPLIVVLLVTALVGAVIGALVRRHRKS